MPGPEIQIRKNVGFLRVELTARRGRRPKMHGNEKIWPEEDPNGNWAEEMDGREPERQIVPVKQGNLPEGTLWRERGGGYSLRWT